MASDCSALGLWYLRCRLFVHILQVERLSPQGVSPQGSEDTLRSAEAVLSRQPGTIGPLRLQQDDDLISGLA